MRRERLKAYLQKLYEASGNEQTLQIDKVRRLLIADERGLATDRDFEGILRAGLPK
jgi:hypothetical protein